MAGQCPDNSTECLLRQILQANSGYNWNPLTFGFTAVFTIIAFVVSVFALFQQFVAAGPGRLKASARAIGREQNRRRTNTQFDWKEYRFRTIVNVPVIDITKIRDHKATAIDIREDRRVPIRESHRSTPITTDEHAGVVAGWSQLLQDLSLTDIAFDTIQSLTDYLPDDVPAAPAWARVESIVLLCIMKGCIRLIENADGYIDAMGPSSQLAWNMHPSLGPMAVYRTWDLSNTRLHLLKDVQTMLPIFLGELQFDGGKLFKPLRRRRKQNPVYFDFRALKASSIVSWEQCRHDHDHCLSRKRSRWAVYMEARINREGEVDTRSAALATLLHADRPLTTTAFPSRVTSLHSAIKVMYDEYFPWLILGDDLNDHVLSTLCGSSFVQFDIQEATSNISFCNNTNLTSWLPGAASQTPVKSGDSVLLERPALQQPDSSKVFNFGKSPVPPVSTEKIMSSGLRIARPAVRQLSRWLSDETYFSTAALLDIKEAQQWLNYQLAEIDWFLSGMGNDAVCAAGNVAVLGTIKYGVVQFTKISRRFVMPETLDAFNLDWHEAPGKQGYVVVRGYLDPTTTHQLFAYTRDYIDRNRRQLYRVKCPQTAQGFYYATKKPQKSPQSNPSGAATAAATYAASDQSANDAGDPTAPLKTPNKDDVEGEPEASPYSRFSRIVRSSQALDASLSAIAETGEETKAPIVYTSTDGDGNGDVNVLSQQSSENTTTAVDSKPSSPIEQYVGEAELNQWMQGSRKASDGGDDEGAVRVDERVSALEALTFFRAAVFGALLASGTDTSLVLTSDKRYQLVLVQ